MFLYAGEHRVPETAGVEPREIEWNQAPIVEAGPSTDEVTESKQKAYYAYTNELIDAQTQLPITEETKLVVLRATSRKGDLETKDRVYATKPAFITQIWLDIDHSALIPHQFNLCKNELDIANSLNFRLHLNKIDVTPCFWLEIIAKDSEHETVCKATMAWSFAKLETKQG